MDGRETETGSSRPLRAAWPIGRRVVVTVSRLVPAAPALSI